MEEDDRVLSASLIAWLLLRRLVVVAAEGEVGGERRELLALLALIEAGDLVVEGGETGTGVLWLEMDCDLARRGIAADDAR